MMKGRNRYSTSVDVDKLAAAIGDALLHQARPDAILSASQVAALIDHTVLKPEATAADVLKLCEEAKTYRFATVCVQPVWVSLCASQLAGTGVGVCTVAGFPHGATTPKTKQFEAESAIRAGATEVDMVLNAGALKSGEYDLVKLDIAGVAAVCHANGARLKVIFENCLLSNDEKKAACEIAVAAGTDFVKTSTGFSKSGATVEDIALMRKAVGPKLGVKAAGGIRDLDTLLAMVAAGASRIGASASVAIVSSVSKS